MTRPEYPPTRHGNDALVAHGHVVPDPFRWLEHPDDPEVVAWVDAQRAVTEAWFADCPEREWFRDAMRRVLARPRAGVPVHKAGRYLVSRNDGTQAQDTWHVASTLDGLADAPAILDPASWSVDGTSSLASLAVSPDGALLAYGVSEGGSDWNHIRLLDLGTGEPVEDVALVTKFAEPTWLPDARSFCYLAYPDSGRVEGTETKALSGGHLMIHLIGTDADADLDVVSFPEDDRLSAWPQVTDDDASLVVTISRGTDRESKVWVYPIVTVDGRQGAGEPVALVDDFHANFAYVGTSAGHHYFFTDAEAPLGRVVRIATAAISAGQAAFETVISEGDATIVGVALARSALVIETLVDARPVLRRHALDGADLGTLDVPGGAVVGMSAEASSDEVFVGMSSLTSATTSFRVDTATGEVTPLHLVDDSASVAPAITVERRSAVSEDGTPVPYFLVVPDGVELDEPRPTLLYGYGGFNLPVLADYRPGWAAWLAAGGVLAIANLRGGGEFGVDWYDGGRLDNKQRVFDDVIGVAEHLIATEVTTSSRLALYGRSNGGLLVGAAMTQRPELFGCALPQVGVLDLVRYHAFTIGAAWMSDYGDPDDADDLAVLLAYSPLHNVVPGTRYPPTLVLTGDHDDRVVPAHSHKFTAALQEAQASGAPILTRIETATGHGPGKPLAMVADEWADLLAFAAHHTGLDPRVRLEA
ncbi:MAG TPA: prolyl oligopeptidase family serine peptidase [Propionibacteriaceae bacterium]|nr:prolyl oligopeptidase family serine peptidase [Propionibacteriaceae bacterium]